MKAIVYHKYGSPDVLKCEEIEKPAAGDDEVLIRVRAASVNPLDWHLMRGEPYIVRAMSGLGKPKASRPGVDLAGQIEAGIEHWRRGVIPSRRLNHCGKRSFQRHYLRGNRSNMR